MLDEHDGIGHFDLCPLKVFNCRRRKFSQIIYADNGVTFPRETGDIVGKD